MIKIVRSIICFYQNFEGMTGPVPPWGNLFLSAYCELGFPELIRPFFYRTGMEEVSMEPMKKLFLSSSFKDVAHLLGGFEQDLRGKKVTFIPTAVRVETYVAHIDAGIQALETMGLIVDMLDVAVDTPREAAEKLKKNDYIYVAGGNTFYLLQEMKKSGADQMIIDEVNAGKLYMGESAGAMVTSKNIGYVKAMDPIRKAPELTDLDALGLVEFYTVPHYLNAPFEKAAQSMVDDYTGKLKLVPISNSQAILVSDGRAVVMSI